MKLVIYGLLLILFINLKGCACENLKLLILHNNDMHSRFEEVSKTSGTCKDKSNCYGGFARVLHVIREARKAAADGSGPPVLYLNAGDTYTGTSWFSVHKWKIAADFMNLLHPDVASFGNHEFAYSPSGLAPYLNAVTFPLVACNVNFSQESELNSFDIPKSWILEVGGKSLGIIGYITPKTSYMGYEGNLKFYDEIPAIISESEVLAGAGIKTIIALGHSGYTMDQQIGREVPLVDLVIGGHTNTYLCNGPKLDLETCAGQYPTVVIQSNGKKVPVVQAYAYTKYMGRLCITINDDGNIVDYGGYAQLLNSSVPQEADALTLLDKFRTEIDIAENQIVGYSQNVLDGELKKCRYKECTLGNFVTDAFVSYYRYAHGDNAISIISSKTLYHDIVPKPDGRITMLDILNAFPFTGKVYSMTLTGLDIWKTLEIGVASNGETTGSEFIHTSGIQYNFNRSRPIGSRVIEVKVRCNECDFPVDLNLFASYRIITTELLYEGVDQHYVVKNNGNDVFMEYPNETEIVLWYLSENSMINVKLEERILEIV